MSGQRKWSLTHAAVLCGVAACFCASAPVHAGAPVTALGPSDRTAETIVVQAVGFATMETGVSLEQAHETALQNARLNALNQALVELEAEREVVDRRVTESLVRARALGLVREINVEEAGVVAGSDPPVYRVLVRALISSSAGDSAAIAGLPAAGWMPSVALRLSTNEAGGVGAARADGLRRGLAACGVQVVPADSSTPHLLIDVQVVQASGGDNEWTRAAWRVVDPNGPSAEDAVVPLTGKWQVASQAGPESADWKCLAVRLAQDSLKVWLWPRPAKLQVTGLARDDAEALVQTLRRVPSSHIERSLDDATVGAELTVVGCPVAYCGALLDIAGVASRYAVQSASLTNVVFGPRAEEPAGDDSAAEPAGH
jgi:hypothetical protein